MMTGRGDDFPGGPGGIRSTFEIDRALTLHNIDNEGITAARTMALMMAGVEEAPFDQLDFMFVASMGQPGREREAMEQLDRACALRHGEIAGLASEQQLQAVGLVAPIPVTMDVYVGFPDEVEHEQYQRRLSAELNLTHAVRRATEDAQYPPVDIQVVQQGMLYSHTIMQTWGEHDYRGAEPTSAFHNVLRVLSGPDEVVAFVAEHDDEIGRQQVARFMDGLAALAEPDN